MCKIVGRTLFFAVLPVPGNALEPTGVLVSGTSKRPINIFRSRFSTAWCVRRSQHTVRGMRAARSVIELVFRYSVTIYAHIINLTEGGDIIYRTRQDAIEVVDPRLNLR